MPLRKIILVVFQFSPYREQVTQTSGTKWFVERTTGTTGTTRNTSALVTVTGF